MFDYAARRRYNLPIVLSVSLHCLLLTMVLTHRQEAIFVSPTSVAYGNSDKAYHLVYLSPEGAEGAEAVAQTRLTLQAPASGIRPRRGRATPQKPSATQEGEASDRSARAGTPYGSLLSGAATGHDVRPGYPVVFPDPPIDHAEIPSDVKGDVIVEVTIDDRGNVVDARLLQGVGHGIDEKIMATLLKWRYHPALIDGRPIASKHDVHFHFPA